MATNAQCDMEYGCVNSAEKRLCGHYACDSHCDITGYCPFCVYEMEELFDADEAEWQAEQERGFLERFEARARYQAETMD